MGLERGKEKGEEGDGVLCVKQVEKKGVKMAKKARKHLTGETTRKKRYKPLEQEQIRILQKFAVSLLKDMKEIDADMAQVINEKFWDIYERF